MCNMCNAMDCIVLLFLYSVASIVFVCTRVLAYTVCCCVISSIRFVVLC
jgi:hypothetical protein